MNIPEKVHAILDEAKAHDKPLPSLRSLRSQVGGGSLTTISEAVKSWRFAQLEAAGQIPQISEKTKVHLADVVWQAMMPILQTQVEGVRQKAEAGIEIERAESRKLFSASEEMLREAESKEAMIGQLNDRLQRQSRECAELPTQGAMQRTVGRVAATAESDQGKGTSGGGYHQFTARVGGKPEDSGAEHPRIDPGSCRKDAPEGGRQLAGIAGNPLRNLCGTSLAKACVSERGPRLRFRACHRRMRLFGLSGKISVAGKLRTIPSAPQLRSGSRNFR